MKRFCLATVLLSLLATGAASALPALRLTNIGPGFEVAQTGTNPVNFPGSVRFSITSDVPIPAGTRVAYQFERLSAIPGGRVADYYYDYSIPIIAGDGVVQLNPGLLVFTGTNSGGVTISVPVVPDTFVEGTEMFRLRLFEPSGCTLAQDSAYGEIVDDDEGWVAHLQGRTVWTNCRTIDSYREFKAEIPADVQLGERPQVSLAQLDNDRDSTPELLVSSGSGPVTTVTMMTLTGYVFASFLPFDTFTGGAYIATGDMDGDGVAELVCGAGAGGTPLVNVYTFGPTPTLSSYRNPTIRHSFFAAPVTFSGGIRVACGDINHDSKADYVTCTGPGIPNQTFMYDGVNNQAIPNPLYNHYGAFAGGAYVALCDLDHDGYSDVLLGAGEGGGSHVKVFSHQKNAYIDEFFMDSQTTGVVVGGQPAFQDPRGVVADPRFFLLNRMGIAMFGHPTDNTFKYRREPGGTQFTEIYGTSGYQSFSGWIPVEPNRPYAAEALSPKPATIYYMLTLGAEPPSRPFPESVWVTAIRSGFRYDLETSPDLQQWTVQNLPNPGQFYIPHRSAKGFFRIRERPFAPEPNF